MDLGRLKTVAGEAALLHIRYYSSLIDLSRDYLTSLKVMVEGIDGEASQTGSPPSPSLVLAARAGETAEAVFSVVNQLKRQVAADVVVSGDIPLDNTRTEPQGKVLNPGEEGVFRILFAMDDSIELGRDRHGVVSVPGLASRSIPLILRRLADAKAAEPSPPKTEAKGPKKKRASRQRARQRTSDPK